MSRIVIGITSIEVSADAHDPTTADLRIVVKDHPANVANHLRLLGILSASTIVLSDDEGQIKLEIRKKE